jgi:hypothetical protein
VGKNGKAGNRNKPNSVPPEGGDGHLSRPSVALGLNAAYPGLQRCGPHLGPYLALLRAGFALPRRSRAGRCALTLARRSGQALAKEGHLFTLACARHSSLRSAGGPSAVCFLRHFPSPAGLPAGAPDLLGAPCPAEFGLSSPRRRLKASAGGDHLPVSGLPLPKISDQSSGRKMNRPQFSHWQTISSRARSFWTWAVSSILHPVQTPLRTAATARSGLRTKIIS